MLTSREHPQLSVFGHSLEPPGMFEGSDGILFSMNQQDRPRRHSRHRLLGRHASEIQRVLQPSHEPDAGQEGLRKKSRQAGLSLNLARSHLIDVGKGGVQDESTDCRANFRNRCGGQYRGTRSVRCTVNTDLSGLEALRE